MDNLIHRMMRNRFLYSILRICIAAVLVTVCGAVDEKWKWKEELLGPSAASNLLTSASAKSPDKKICADKAMVRAGDKMQIKLSDLLESFLKIESIELAVDDSVREKAWNILVNAEILAMEKIKTFSLNSAEIKNGYKCDITITIDIFNVLSSIEAASSVDSVVNEMITGSGLFKQLQTEAQVGGKR